MPQSFVNDRRRFLGSAAMTLAAARLGMVGTLEVNESEPRLLAALGRANAWVNSPAVSAASLEGKVVLVQFGTYTCINWLRTLPYVRAWARRYEPGLAIIVVHTPEFVFEKSLENVRRAVEQMKIGFALAVDNDYAIWRAFDNHYWPAVYLLDTRGRLRQHHFGEAQYEQLERTIQQLLGKHGANAGGGEFGAVAASGFELPADWGNLKSPETYLGHDRTQNFSSPEGARLNRARVYSVPNGLKLNRWGLAGEWTMANQPTILQKAPGSVVCRFHARDVHLVMGPARQDRPVRFRVSLDQQPPGSAHGSDLDAGGNGTVVEQRLYQLIRQPTPILDRTFEIEFLDAGVEVFAFTFG